jgi:DNA-binding SARP family transcriptional activator
LAVSCGGILHYGDTYQSLATAQDDARMPLPDRSHSALAGGDDAWAARVLGPLEVRAGSARVELGGPQQRLVLALLLVRAGHPVATEQLIADVWSEDPPQRARKTIQVYASNLRRCLGGGEGPLQPATNGYRLAIDRINIDAVAFERAIVQDTDPSYVVNPAETARRSREALDLWVGAPYADVPAAGPVGAERVRLAELRLVALERRIDADLALGRHRELIGELEALTIDHPYRERFVAQLMLAQYRAGRQADALQTLRRARRTLDEELGIEPGTELRALERRILNQDDALELPAVATPPVDGSNAAASNATDPSDRARGPRGSIRGYELRQTLAVVGDVVTYRAYQASLGREVVIKMIGPSVANTPGFIRRFGVEAQRVAQLEHPHIVALRDHWRDPDGAYLVADWLRGGRLADVLSKQRMPTSTALRIVAQVGSALSYVHRKDVVHGHVTPAAVLLDDDGNAYLGDFSIVAEVVPDWTPDGSDATGSATTATGRMSPGRDVLGLAALAHELLTGRRPVMGEAVMEDRLPPELCAVLSTMLSADPALRPHKADDVVRALKRVAGWTPSGSSTTRRARSPTYATPTRGCARSDGPMQGISTDVKRWSHSCWRPRRRTGSWRSWGRLARASPA